MGYISTVTSKGQITVPQEVRQRLGLKEGDRIEFLMQGSQMVVRPVRGTQNPFETYVGALGDFAGGRQEIEEWISELRDDDES